MQHQDCYLHYCPMDKCNWGMDEVSTLPEHIRKVHKRKPASDVVAHAIICPKCKQQFAQQQKLNNHILICGTQAEYLLVASVKKLSGVLTS